MTTEIKEIFPVSVLHHKVPVRVKDSSHSVIHKFIEDHPSYVEMTYAEMVKTSYKPEGNDFIGDAQLMPLFSEIMQACNLYMQKQNVFTFPDVYVQSWLNVFEPNAVESVHEHFGSFLSGCYYVDTPEDCGEIVFKQESARRAWAAEYTYQVGSDLSGIAGDSAYAPKAGDMLIFPPWLPHEVRRNRSAQNRISIAFNLVVARRLQS